MLVKILKPTRFQGKSLSVGATEEVPNAVSLRWINAGIAEPVEVFTPEAPEAPEVNGEVDAPVNYDDLQAKELYALCLERGIEVEAKKSKAAYIELLVGADTDTEAKPEE